MCDPRSLELKKGDPDTKGFLTCTSTVYFFLESQKNLLPRVIDLPIDIIDLHVQHAGRATLPVDLMRVPVGTCHEEEHP